MKNKVYGIVFKNNAKVYYFKSKDEYKKDDEVVVETEKGQQYGKVYNILENYKDENYKEIIRKATKEDTEKFYKNLKDGESAATKAKELVKELGLEMNIINANFNYDRSQLLINFSADDRIDFRELAKKLAGIYRTRIELRQIGARDKAKQISGIGVCGQKLCCSAFLNQIDTISMNKAKNQGLALNPSKINGSCGRLLCCLSYEDDEYTRCSKGLFPVGAKVKYKGEEGTIASVNILARSYKVIINDEKIDVTHEELYHGKK